VRGGLAPPRAIERQEEGIPLMPEAKQQDTVRVHYTGTLDDGSVFDSSVERDPIEFTIGEGRVIPGFEQAVLGMSPGDTRTVRIDSANAYGPYRDDMVLTVKRSQFPPEIEPSVGQTLQVQQTNGEPLVVTVSEVTDAAVKLDANHPLAGKDLIFEVQLVEIR
jgi:peptidylprolyl isomerase